MGSNEVTGNLHRGKWAGDNVCIITLDQLVESLANTEWTDISTTVVRDLIYCCKAEFGERWLEVIKKGPGRDAVYEMHWMASDGDDRVAKCGRLIGLRPPRPSFWL